MAGIRIAVSPAGRNRKIPLLSVFAVFAFFRGHPTAVFSMSVPVSKSHAPGCWRWLLLICVAIALTGCATSQPATARSRLFAFEQDTFAYPIELVCVTHIYLRGK